MTPFRLSLAALFILTSMSLGAPQVDRRSRDEPEITVEAGGRVGTCDVLTFLDDGKSLLAAGDDKVARIWPVTDKGIETDREKVQVLRWPAWREQRGGIKAVAVSGDRVAIGGFGMRISSVVVLDRSGQFIASTSPIPRKGFDDFNAVVAITFHPSGKELAFATADGSLWSWDMMPLPKVAEDGSRWTTPKRIGKHEAIPNDYNRVRLLTYQGKDKLLSVAQSGEILVSKADGTGATPKGNIHDGLKEHYKVYRALLTPDGNLVAACQGPVIVVRSLEGNLREEIRLEKDSFPRSLALDARGEKLAVGVGGAMPGSEERFFLEKNDDIRIIDLKTMKETKKLPHTGPAEALAYHPDGRLAIAGGDSDEITLLDPMKDADAVKVQGAGRKLWQVNLSENGKVLGVRGERDAKTETPNRRGAGDWTLFDIPRMKPTRDEPKWLGSVDEADGWKVVQNPENRFLWSVVRAKDGKRHTIDIGKNQNLAPNCWTFLPAREKLPTRLIVGHGYGCSLFEITDESAVRTKLYTGHAGEVLSVVAAKDQSWFVTSSADQTVAGWSLVDWANQPALGASFRIAKGKLVVNAVATGSPAWEAGLSAGQTIELLAVGGEKIFDGKESQLDSALKALETATSGKELHFELTTKNGDQRRTLTTVRQRPLWKWFPAFDDKNRFTDWVIWMWNGSYYHTKSAHGDRLVGWHVNHPEIDGKPEFYRLDQFEKQFHRLDVLERIVNGRKVAEALEIALGENPEPMKFSRYEPAPVRVGAEKGGDGAAVSVSVSRRGSNPDLLPEKIELWVNDFRYKSWTPGGKAVEEKVNIPASALVAGENRVAVLSFNPLGGRAEAGAFVVSTRNAESPQLLGLAAGINDYGNHRKNTTGARAFGDLKSARRDAEAIADRFESYRGPDKYFRAGNVSRKLDAQAARKDLLSALADLKTSAKPDDQLVVFFAGHGDLATENKERRDERAGGARGGFLGDPGVFVFCCPDYSPVNATGTGLSSEELFEALASVNCRKLVLLDACHAGQATNSNVIRRLIPDGQGPVVMAACDQSELSFEHPDPKVGHGLFTYAVVEALGDKFRKADRNSDGAITAQELHGYVSDRVPLLVREIGRKSDTQTPICFPREARRFTIVKK